MSGLLAAATEPATTSDVLAFHLHGDVLGVVAALIVGYEFALRRLAPRLAPRDEPAITTKQRVAFYAGTGALLAVSAWPVHDIGERSLFMFHMVEHMVFGFAAPPLLLLGVPWWLLRALVAPVLPLLRILVKPFVALFLFNAVIGLVHVPAVVDLMIRSDAAHFGIHLLLFATGVLMWWRVVDPIPDLPHLAPFLKMGYVFLQSLVPTIPASFLTLGDKPLYPIYETMPRLWGISAHTDQVIAGLMMKLGGGLLLWGVMAGIFFRWWAEEQRLDAEERALRSTASSAGT
jgi:putative membrane protein